MKICKYCSTKLSDGDERCTACGAEEFYQIVDDGSSGNKVSLSVFKAISKAPSKVKTAVLIGTFLLVCLLGMNVFQLLHPYNGPDIQEDTIQFGFKDIGELATQAAYYTEIVSDKNYRPFFNTDINVPGTKRHTIVSYDGVIKAGLDFNDISYTVDDENKVITIELPPIKLLSNVVDNSSMQVWLEQKNIFNPATLSDNNDLFLKIKSEAEKHATKQGLFDNALENAKIIIENMCKMVLPDYTVVFE